MLTALAKPFNRLQGGFCSFSVHLVRAKCYVTRLLIACHRHSTCSKVATAMTIAAMASAVGLAREAPANSCGSAGEQPLLPL